MRNLTLRHSNTDRTDPGGPYAAPPARRGVESRLGLTACAILAFASWTNPVQGQTLSALQPDLVGASHLSVTPSVYAAYDTNVVHGTAAVARTHNLSVGDEIYGPRIDADVLRPFGNISLFVRGYASYNFYVRDHIFNSQGTDISGGAEYFLGPCRITGSGNYLQVRNDLEGANANGVVALTPNVQTIDGGSVDLGCQRTIGFSPTLTFTETQSRNDSVARQYIDYDSTSTRAGVVYQRPSIGSLSLFGEYDDLNYANRFVNFATSGPKDGYQSYSVGLQYTRPIGSRLQATAQIMYTDLMERSSLTPGFSGLAYSGELIWQVTGRLTLLANAALSTTPSNQLGASFSRDQRFGGEVDYRFTPRLTLAAGGSRVDRHYEGFELDPLIEVTQIENDEVHGSATYAFARRVSLTLDVREQSQHTNIAAFQYSGARVSLTASAHF